MNATTYSSGLSAICRGCGHGLLLAVLLALAACRSVAPGAPASRPCWPPPPAPPRVQFLQSVEGPRDLGIAPTLWQRTLNVVTGGHRGAEPWIRPFGVCLNEDGSVCFTDTERGEVVYADVSTQHLWRWNRVGTVVLVSPVSVACASGLVYVADSGLGRVLIATPQGQPRGEIAFAFRRPVGVAIGADRICVADAQAGRVEVFDLAGRWTRTIGQSGNGPGELNHPTHVAMDRIGCVYVTDTLNSRVQVFDVSGALTCTIGGRGDSSGHFGRPKGVSVDQQGRVFVVDGLFGVVQIFDAQGRLLLDFGEPGQDAGQFWLPSGIAVNARGLIAVADSYNRRLQLFQLLPDKPPAARPADGPGGHP